MTDASDPSSVNFIRQRREELGLSQETLGEMVGKSGMSISRAENDGSATMKELAKIAEALSCSPSQLVPAPPRTYVLTPEEEQLLLWYRAVGQGERRSITTLARGLHEAQPVTFEHRKQS